MEPDEEKAILCCPCCDEHRWIISAVETHCSNCGAVLPERAVVLNKAVDGLVLKNRLVSP